MAAAVVPRYGQPSRAVGGPASRPEQRRQKRLGRELPAAAPPLEPTVRAAARQAEACRAEAEAAAATVRAVQSASHRVEGRVEARPQSGPGRPRQPRPRVGNTLRDGGPGARPARAEGLARTRPATGGLVRLPPVPSAGERGQRAGAVLRADTEPQGRAQHDGGLQAPRIGNRLCLQQPARRAALGLVVGLARRRGRLGARTRRGPVETPGPPWTGWDKQATPTPTACMRMTQVAAVMGRTVGGQRPLAHPLSTLPPPYLVALRVPATYGTAPQRGSRNAAGHSRSHTSPG